MLSFIAKSSHRVVSRPMVRTGTGVIIQNKSTVASGNVGLYDKWKSAAPAIGVALAFVWAIVTTTKYVVSRDKEIKLLEIRCKAAIKLAEARNINLKERN